MSERIVLFVTCRTRVFEFDIAVLISFTVIVPGHECEAKGNVHTGAAEVQGIAGLEANALATSNVEVTPSVAQLARNRAEDRNCRGGVAPVSA